MRRAGEADVARVVAILEEASAWQRSIGVEQWPARFAAADVARRLRRAEGYLAWDGAQAVGTFTLQTADPVVWGERRPDALYLHGLAVRRSHAGLGRDLLAFAERATAAAGRSYLRLDCMAANQRLRAYYERAGFRHCGEWRSGGWTAALYEKAVHATAEQLGPANST